MRDIYLYSVPMAGATVLHLLASEVGERLGLPMASGPRVCNSLRQTFGTALGSTIVGPLLAPQPGPELPCAQVVVHVRDPRDVLTASCLGKQPAEAAQSSCNLDTRVLKAAEELRKLLAGYKESFLGRQGLIVSRYEHMAQNFPAWMEEFLRVFSGGHAGKVLDAEELRRELGLDSPGCIGPEYASIGCHRKHLAPETITVLNAVFADILPAFGYHDGVSEAA